jgi:hypothetical protein
MEGNIMAIVEKPETLTIRISDRAVIHAMKALADERNMTAHDLALLAFREWLEYQEELEDIAAIAAVKDEPTIPWEQVREEMRQARESAHGA